MKTLPHAFGDYVRMYGGLPVSGKVVLDVGADYGSTAEFFLGRGAKQVLVSERNPEWRDRLVEWAKTESRITVLPDFAPETAQSIMKLRPDVVKMDCERCETFLAHVPDVLVSHPSAWVMETHTKELYRDITARLARLGYVVSLVVDYGVNKQGKALRVFQAER